MPKHDDANYAVGGGRGPVPQRPGLGSFFSVSDVALYLGVSPKTVRRMVNDGELAAVRVRGQIRIQDKAVTAYLDQVQS